MPSAARMPAAALPEWLRVLLPEGIKRYRLDVGGHRMAFMELGSGPPVLLVHGNPSWGFLWRKVAEELRNDGLRLIMPDLLGLGFSDRPGFAEHTLEHHAAWLRRAVLSLELESPIVVGQDWGGPISLLAASQFESRPRALVLLNTVTGPPHSESRPTYFHRLANVPVVSDVLFRGLGLVERLMFTAQGDRRSIGGDVARAYRYPLRDRRSNQAPLALARMVPTGEPHPSIPALERCQAFHAAFEGPIEIVWGKRDPVLGRALGRVTRTNPRAHVTETNAGHFLQEEVPGPIADAIRAAHAASRGALTSSER